MSDTHITLEHHISPEELHQFIRETRINKGKSFSKAASLCGKEKGNYRKLELPTSNPELETITQWATANNYKLELRFTALTPQPQKENQL